MAKLAGAKWFLTQKISWNQVNDFPHHSFWWEGIDGTRIFTHFPPADTYGSDLANANVHHAARNFRDKGRADISLVPFGYGDGGGGPTREMLWQASRLADLDGSPKVRVTTPREFFEEAESRHESPSVWTGELYLELHRGTFTSVASVKRGNRRSEHLLREAELWCATAAVRGLMDYPLERLGELWREVCLYQFHDILPGTCISWVYEEVLAGFARIEEEVTSLIATAQDLLAGEGDEEVWFNAAPVPIDSVVALGAAGRAPVEGGVTAAEGVDGTTLDNGLTRVLIRDGAVVSLIDVASGRETVPPGKAAGVLALHPDFPNEWDAWDIDATAFNTVRVIDGTQAAPEEADGEAAVVVGAEFGGSAATLRFALRAGDPRLHVTAHVDWQERDTLLKLLWPIDVHTDSAVAEIEMGHLRRPTHTNTSWDAQRFEVHAHRWLQVGEDDFGVAIANAQTYGWNVTRHARDGGATFSQVGATLLKGARFPDPRADIGHHDFTFTVHAGAGIAEAVVDGYAANLPLRPRIGSPVEPIVRVDGPVMVEALKLAEDGSGDVVVRLYEPHGRRAQATLTPGFDVTDVVETDLHECRSGQPWQQVAASAVASSDAGVAHLTLRPFQVVTLRLREH